MKNFIEAYQTLIREGNDIMLLMTGLYENVRKLQDNPSLTFLYRLQKINLGSLSSSLIAVNYELLLGISKDKAMEYAKFTKGYAYAYQVLGYLLYESLTRTIDSRLLASFDTTLAEQVYEKIYTSLSKNEKTIINSIDSNSPIKVAELVKKTNMSNKTIGVYRDRMIKIGILKSPSYGYLEFTLPRFYEFIKSRY